MTDAPPPPRYPDAPEDLAGRDVLLSMSGLDFLCAMLAGQITHPAMARTIGARLESVAPGIVRFLATPAFAHTNPMGAVHGGWYGTLLDTALGCVVMTAVPQGRWYTTLEYKVNLCRALPLGQEVRAIATLDHAGRTTAVARAEVRGVADDRVYATGSTTCLIMG